MTRSLLTLSFALLTSCTPTVELDPVRVNDEWHSMRQTLLGLAKSHLNLEARVSVLEGTPTPTPAAVPHKVIGPRQTN